MAVARSVKKRAAGAVTVGGTTATVGGTLTIGGETVLVTTENENAVLVGGSIIDGSGSGGEVVQAEYIVEDEHGNKYSAGGKSGSFSYSSQEAPVADKEICIGGQSKPFPALYATKRASQNHFPPSM